MMKRILLFLLLFFSLTTNAQRLTFSSELGYFSNDENINSIKKMWASYINAVAAEDDTTPFWIKGSSDILLGTHKDGLLNTYNIRRLTDEIYEINTIAYYPHQAIKGGLINSIYKVCAQKTDNGWRLMNYFDATKSRYASYLVGSVDFYIGHGVVDDQKKDERGGSICRFIYSQLRFGQGNSHHLCCSRMYRRVFGDDWADLYANAVA